MVSLALKGEDGTLEVPVVQGDGAAGAAVMQGEPSLILMVQVVLALSQSIIRGTGENASGKRVRLG